LIKEMDSVVKTVEMGRHARNKASLKIRQPLKKLLFATEDSAISEAILSNKDQILDELNVKGIERVSSYSDLLTRELKPNYATIGEKFSDRVKDIALKIKNFSYKEFEAKFGASTSIILSCNGEDYELEKQDFIVSEQSIKGKSSVSQGDLIVSVITELSTDLIQEGYIREIVRSLQNMRKEADFNVEDRIKVFCLAENDMGDVIRKHEDYFRSEVLAVELYFGEIKGELTKEISVGGDAILFGISRVKD